MTDQEKPPEATKETKQARRKARLITLRATVPYYNGTLQWGLPPWRRGETRDVPLEALKQFNEDAPGVFEIVGEAGDDEG